MHNTIEIINENLALINELKEEFISLNEKCNMYVENYDKYLEQKEYDTSILKNRMKNVIVRAVSNEE